MCLCVCLCVHVCVCVQGEQCVLMAVVTGEALSLLRDLQDSQVVDLCMSVLRELFQEQVMCVGRSLVMLGTQTAVAHLCF